MSGKEMTHRISFILILLSGIAIRLLYLTMPSFFDSDQAVMGLMAKHILEGEFPVFFWGENYCGPLESYLASIFFYLFGMSTFTLGISPFLFSIGFMFITYKLAKEIVGEKGGLIALLLVSIAPPFLIWHSVLARGNYIENLTFGSLILLVTYRIIYKESKIYLYCILGFLGGLAWYISPQAIHYIIVSGIFLFLKDKRIFFRRRSFLIILFFFLGSLPFWIYNLINGWPSFSDIAIRHTYRAKYDIPSLLTIFFNDMLQSLLGAPVLELKAFFNPSLNLFITLTFCLTIIYIIVERRKALISILKLSLNETKGIDIFILLLFLSSLIVIFLFSDRTTTRFYLPLYAAISILISYFVLKIMERSKGIGILIFSLFLSSNLYGALTNATILQPEAFKEERNKEKDIIRLCKEKALRYIYTPEFWIAFKLTFYAKEEVVFVMPQRDQYARGYPVNKYPHYTDLADKSLRYGYLLHDSKVITGGFTASAFEENLRLIGGSYKKDSVGPYVLFYDLEPPPEPLKAINTSKWKASSNYNPYEINKAFDRDIFTRWHTIRQPPGAFFEIDLGRPYKLSKASILTGPFLTDMPRGYRIEVSRDGRLWRNKAELGGPPLPLIWRDGRLRYEPLGIAAAILEPEEARYMRITIKGITMKDPIYDWSIAEIFLYEGIGLTIKDSYSERQEDIKEALKKSIRQMEEDPDSGQGFINFSSINKRLKLRSWPEVISYLVEQLKDSEYGWKIFISHPSDYTYLLTKLKGLYQKQGDYMKVRSIEERFKREFTPSEDLDINFGNQITFIGYNIDKKELRAGDSFYITYYWKVIDNIEKDWVAFVHFIGPDGRIAFQNDHLLYTGGVSSSDWIKGEIYKERLPVMIPEDIPSGSYDIWIGIWDLKKRLKVEGQEAEQVFIGGIKIKVKGQG